MLQKLAFVQFRISFNSGMRLIFLAILMTLYFNAASSQCCIESPLCPILPIQTCLGPGTYSFQVSSTGSTGNQSTASSNVIVDDDGFAELENSLILTNGELIITSLSNGELLCELDITITRNCKIVADFKDLPCQMTTTESNTLYEYCVGDSTSICFDVYGATPDPYPFFPDLIDFEDGRIVNFNDTSFVILWERPGLQSWSYGCLPFTGSGTGPLTGSGIGPIGVQINSIEAINIFVEDNLSDTIVICEDEQVFFQIEKDGIENIVWSLTDGRSFEGLVQNILFEEAGFYELTASFDSDCNCSTDGNYFIEVVAGQSPNIDCVSKICIGSEADYYASDDCDTYIWDVGPGGVIKDGGGVNDPYIRVQWMDGDNTQITLSTPGCFTIECKETTTVNVPVIGDDLKIEGATVVCAGDVEIYYIPEFDNLNFLWGIGAQFGSITDRTQRLNPTEISWHGQNEFGSSIISVSYENCFLDCSGISELEVFIKPDLYIIYDKDKLCQNTDYTFTNNLDAEVNWILTGPNGTVDNLDAPGITVNLSEPGQYSLQANDIIGNFCEPHTSINFEVLQPITPPTTIMGPKLICLGESLQYRITNVTTNLIPRWTVYDGSNIFTYGASNQINVEWMSSGPYRIEVRLVEQFSQCESMAVEFELSNQSELNGKQDICLGEEVIYTLRDYENGVIDWSIEPVGAGNIINENNDSLSVRWISTGLHTLTAYHCGLSANFTTTVNEYPTLSIEYDEVICLGTTALLNIITEINNSIEIFDTTGILLIQNQINPRVDTGEYIIKVSNPIGCEVQERINITAAENRQIKVSPFSTSRCIPFSLDMFITNPTSALDYEWIYNGAAIGQDSFFNIATQHGTYLVIGTDKYGCQYFSDEIILANPTCCASLPNPPSDAPSSVSMNSNNLNCLNWEFEIKSPYLGSNWEWNFDDFASGNNTATGINASHEFSGIGYYNVRAQSDLPCVDRTVELCGNNDIVSYCETAGMLVTIPLESRFKAYNVCLGDTLFFENTSPLLSAASNVKYNWDFGDPSSISNSSTDYAPYHIYDNSGSYTVQLELIDDSGCSSTSSQNIEVYNIKDIDIISADTICIASLMNFIISDETGLTQINWNFGDPNSGDANKVIANQTTHTFTDFGNFVVTVSAKNINGCYSYSTKLIHVIDNVIDEQITALTDTLICEDDVINLMGPVGDYKYEWSTNETTQSIDVSEPGEYTLTITNTKNCNAILDPFRVQRKTIPEYCIQANAFSSGSFKNELTICENVPFTLNVLYANGAEVTWPEFGVVGHYLDSSHLNNLSIGNHEIKAFIEHPDINCLPIEAIFSVEIVESLPNIIIQSESAIPCANEINRFSVTPYDSTLIYNWHNGDRGESTSSIGDDIVSVIVTNGVCQLYFGFLVEEAPGPVDWLDGCTEVCFPKSFCFSGFPGNEYVLYKDGVFYDSIDFTAIEFIITEPGDWQLEYSRGNCMATTDIMTIIAAPQSRIIEGIVFLDLNNNGMHDPGEAFLPMAIIRLFSQGMLVAETSSDSVGYYLFEDIVYDDIELVIDTSLFPEFDTYFVDSLFIFDGCFDEKELDIAFIGDCISESNDTIYTCQNSMISYNGQEYNAGENDLIIFTNSIGCDSLVNLTVLPFDDDPLDYILESSCLNNARGTIDILNPSVFVEYYLNETEVQLDNGTLDGLTPGEYTFVSRSQNDCLDTIQFTIDTLETAMGQIITNSSCAGINNGSVNITTDLDVHFQLNGIPVNPVNGTIEQLGPGDYTLLFTTNEGCVDSILFEIDGSMTEIDETQLIKTPNLFSPNADGWNDCYTLHPNEDYELIALSSDIFDRWGQLVFTSEELDACWDGQFNDEPCALGVYGLIYQADFRYCDTIFSVRDATNVTLLR